MDRPVATGRNILTGALKLFKRGKHGGALVVPAQATSCREESPDRSLEPKPWLQRTVLEVPADNLEAPQCLLRMLPKEWHSPPADSSLILEASRSSTVPVHRCL